MSSSRYTRLSILTAWNSTRLSPVGRTDVISASWTTRVRLPIYTTVGWFGSFVTGTSGGMAERVTVRPLTVTGIGGLAVPSGLRIITTGSPFTGSTVSDSVSVNPSWSTTNAD